MRINYLLKVLSGILVSTIGLLSTAVAQELIRYDEENQIAKVHCAIGWDGGCLDKDSEYPVRGAYNPTHWGMHGVKQGVGSGNYIYLETNGVLKPGKQYRINMTLRVEEVYDDLPYFQEHLGIALSSHLINHPNQMGLWRGQFVPLDHMSSEELVTLSFEFRPLCTSKYVVLGVFQGPDMPEIWCNFCRYGFHLYSMTVSESENLENEFHYLCDAHEEENFASGYDPSTATIFFESGSSEISGSYTAELDSVPAKLSTSQDLINLFAYTDKKGSDNDKLGADRNASVRKALLERGIDSTRILMINFGESEASEVITGKDRRVDVAIYGKLYQKHYTEALEASAQEDYGTAHKLLLKKWIRMVPPDQAIYGLFDCWGTGPKAEKLKQNLAQAVQSKFYRGQQLKFTLDSLFCEDKKGKMIRRYLSKNRLPSYSDDCGYDNDITRAVRHRRLVDTLYAKHGIPEKEEVGKLANNTLPSLISETDDLAYLKKYLPIVKEASQLEKVSWSHYATIYDKIMNIETGFQRYGTQITVLGKQQVASLCPYENVHMVKEYRRQVKLSPLTKENVAEIIALQSNIDTTLVSQLNTIYQSDQGLRLKAKLIEKEHGENSLELEAHWQVVRASDSINLKQVALLLDKQGWLGPDIVGHQGSTTLFLVIQHSDLETQLKYLPLMRAAHKDGKFRGQELALLEDRISIAQGRKQIYGSQISSDPDTGEHYLAPLSDPTKVNERRAAVGLGRIEDYVKRWGIEWDATSQQ